MVSEMYFRLNPECYLIRGERLGAIFDLIDEKIYGLDQLETNIVTSCERNNPVVGNESFLKELKQLRVGNFYENRVYVQKLRIGSHVDETDPFFPFSPPELHRAFLEINNSCDRDCWFCGFYGIKRSMGCMGCNKWRGDGKTLTIERWKEVIEGLNSLDCRDIFITGGDLTLIWDKAIDILDYADGKFCSIYMILHQESISSREIEDLKDKAKIIAQTEVLHDEQCDDIINLLIVKPGDLHAIKKINGRNIMKDFIVHDKSCISNKVPLTSKKRISAVDMYKFWSNLEYHPCLGHTLSICYNGDVIPCPMMRDHCFGNVIDKDVHNIFETNWEDINKFWRFNLDEIERCTGCEFRYSCSECRALEEELTGRLNGKILCDYNPKEGEWI